MVVWALLPRLSSVTQRAGRSNAVHVCRCLAQLVAHSRLGRRGCRFESCDADQISEIADKSSPRSSR